MLKSPTTYTQQVKILKSRGCIIYNDAECEKILSNLNYYRLSAYFIPYKNTNNKYKPNTIFENIVKLYNFDRKIRNILFGAIETLEILLKARFAYYHAHTYGALGYLNSKNYNEKHDHGEFQKHIFNELKNNKKIPFVKHHNKKYNGEFPIWVIIELFTFGMLSYFYSDLVTEDKKKLSKEIWGTHYRNIESWLVCCTNLRNICAHVGRLYNQTFTAIPASTNQNIISKKNERKLWGAIFALKSLYPNKEQWNIEVATPISNLIFDYKDVIDLDLLGFNKNTWQDEILK